MSADEIMKRVLFGLNSIGASGKEAMAFAAIALAGLAVAAPEDGGWRNLFADDLSDAEYDSQAWHRDAEGNLTAEKDVALWTKADYSDFELSCEYNLEPAANSGVLIYASDAKDWIPNAVEIQLLDDAAPKWKGLNPNQANLSFFGHQAPAFNPAKPAGQWNRLVILAEGRKLLVVLNGIPVNECDLGVWKDAKKLPDGSDIPPWLTRPWADLATTGRIGFQGRHAGAGVKFRNIRIRRLPKGLHRVAACRSRTVGLERMDVPRAGVKCAAECGEAIGPAKVWDFTTGRLPEGCALGKAAFLSGQGLGCNDFTNESAQGGVRLTRERTPQGAFLLEAEVEVGNSAPELRREHTGRIWDDMGINYTPTRDNTGLEVSLYQKTDGYFYPEVMVGMGDDTYKLVGERVRLHRGARTKLAVYFGANGRVVIEFAGLVTEESVPAFGSIAPSKRWRPVIGSRPVSNFANMDGFVRKVTLTPMRRDPFVLRTPSRRAFVRGETNAFAVVVENRSGADLAGATVTYEQFCDAGRVMSSVLDVGALAEDEAVEVPCALETCVRPGWHMLRATVEGRDAGGKPVRFSKLVRYGIGPQYADRLRTVIWGVPAALPVTRLRELGVTHGHVYMGSGGGGELEGGADPSKTFAVLDNALVGGLGVTCLHGPAIVPKTAATNRYVRLDCNGRPHKAGWDTREEVSNPELQARNRLVARRSAAVLAEHPACQGVLAYSEKRDLARPSFNVEREIYRKETGRDIPKGVDGRTYPLESAMKRFPDGVVPEDDELYLYYKWYFKDGDGWPRLLTAVYDEYSKRIRRPDFISFWDPAVRCPPIWGSGGSADMLNQWCYAVPEPMNVAGPCEEILAMTAGRPGQQAAIMTQLICYRSQMAPVNVTVDPMPAWAKEFPEAKFPTIPPDVLTEATWSMIAKPVQAIMYHGWATIYDMHGKSYYAYTNPESTERFGQLLNGVVAPLGPTLKRLGRRTPDVAVLESFTTCAMGGPASWGWSAPSITFLQRARLDPRVVYEETILRDGLDGVKVLYAPQLRFTTPRIVAKIVEFQKRGGVLIADKELLPALKADVTVPLMAFEAPPESDHAEDVDRMESERDPQARTRKATVRAKTYMQESAEFIRRELAARGYVAPADSSSADIVVYGRSFGDVPYLFAINDRRTFGDYVGQWGRVMEKGEPNEGWVQVQDPSGAIGAVYELSKGGELPFARRDSRIRVPVRYETNDGRLFVFLKSKIAKVEADVQDAVRRGGKLSVAMTVRDANGRPVAALLPVDIRLYDAAGREIDGVGYSVAENGVAKVEFTTNADDADGDYRLVCADRASGISISKTIRQK